MASGIRIGIDLGGTKTEIIALGPSGQECYRKRVPTPAHSYDSILSCIVRLVEEAEAVTQKGASIGVGSPGSISATSGLMRNSNTACLNGRPLLDDLIRAVGRPVRLSNDANCFTLSEATDGAGAGAEVVFGVILGTGTGGGIATGGRIWPGHNGLAGEWGHNPLPRPQADELPGPACYCGKHGCIETFLSGPGLVRDHRACCGEQRSAEEIVAQAQDHEGPARLTLDRYLDRAARALAGVVNLLDPDVIVLGGGLSNVDALYQELPRRWSAHVFAGRVQTPIRRAAHGDSSGVRGAAWLWPVQQSL